MFQEELDFLKKTLRDAYARAASEKPIAHAKGAFDLVTSADLAIETYVRRAIASRYPGDRLHGEEYSPAEPLQGRTWILDPIDGTYNFASGSPLFGLQGALWDGERTVLSVLYLPAWGEMYEATLNGGAFCNGKRLHVSSRAPAESIVSFGDLSHKRPEDFETEKAVMQRAFSRVARYRMFGAACVDFAMLASGRTEGVVLFTKNQWDIQPGLLLAAEAGAIATDETGRLYTPAARSVFAVNSPELSRILTERLPEQKTE